MPEDHWEQFTACIQNNFVKNTHAGSSEQHLGAHPDAVLSEE
ncbi:hypothetical protein BIW11_02673 [Tropilaelaps mercedesae]|uniref:Uncharacterized protein n=1 Tax=Tropilaelaps mercedesae TaxID=418985 RepID=A0A1V9XZ73_9ACAR|nr:hypothetical protein BIW11_02673 [Tropilaelaps mercedesae]